MTKNIRDGFLLVAGLMVILSSLGGCASSGSSVGDTVDQNSLEISQPTAGDLEKIPEGHPVRIKMAGGEIYVGAYLSYSPETSALAIKLGQDYASPSLEFNEDTEGYSILLDEVATLEVLASPDHAVAAGVSIALATVVVGALVMFAAAMSSLH